MYKDCLGITKEQCNYSRLPHLLMIVLHGETLWSPAPQPMDDDDLALLKDQFLKKNASKKSKKPSPFFRKAIGLNNSFTLIENNFRFLR